jgi:mannitol 2-dehydrogenase
VVTEPFIQWVIEDHFPLGRPAWETVGAQMTHDVLPYEKMKIRLLNASHQTLCYLGMLLGYEFAHQTMEDARIRTLVRTMMDEEVTPLLPAVPGVDLEEYKATLIRRFANPTIRDQLSRIGTEGSARIPKFVLPSVRERLADGGPLRILSLTVAAWFRYLTGADDVGKSLPMNDPFLDELQALARRDKADPAGLLGLEALFGDLVAAPRFVAEVSQALGKLYSLGVERTLGDYSGVRHA